MLTQNLYTEFDNSSTNSGNNYEFEVLTLVAMKNTVFWDVAS
jgi:hypothetical protein